MKKILKFLFLSVILTSSTTLLVSCNPKSVNTKKDQSENQSNSMTLLEKAKIKLETTLIDGSTLNPDDYINSNSNKDKIIRLIKNIINNQDIEVSITNKSFSKKLSQTNNTVNIEISCNLEQKCFDVKFENVESNNDWQSDTKKMIEEIKTKLENSLVDGSILDELLLIESQQEKILELIINFEDKLKTLEIKFTSPETNLSQTNNIVEISIECNNESTSAKVKFKNVKTYSEKTINDLLEDTKNKIINKINCLERQMLISSSKKGMISHIKDIINDERITVEIVSLNKALQEDKVEIIVALSVQHKIFVNKLKKLKFKFNNEKKHRKDWWYNQSDNNNPNKDQKNVELDENKLKQIYEASYHDLVGIKASGKISEDDEKKAGKNFRHLQRYFHTDMPKYRFIKEWYENLKNNALNKSFAQLWTILSFKISDILKCDLIEIKTILETLNNYDEKIIAENEIINKFCAYMSEISKTISVKRQHKTPLKE